jgi:hypothetical protein
MVGVTDTAPNVESIYRRERRDRRETHLPNAFRKGFAVDVALRSLRSLR